jgi:hypothetical protein
VLPDDDTDMRADDRQSRTLTLPRSGEVQADPPRFTVHAEVHRPEVEGHGVQDEADHEAVDMQEQLALGHEVQDEFDHEAVDMQEPAPALAHEPQLALRHDVRDEVDHESIDMQEPAPALVHEPQLALRHDVQDELDYYVPREVGLERTPFELMQEQRGQEVEMGEPPLALTHDAGRRKQQVVGVRDEPPALTYEPEHESLPPLPVGLGVQQPQDEFQPYEIRFPTSSSSSDTEDDRRPLAIGWSGHPEAGESRLRPRPVIHPVDEEWIRRKKRSVPSNSSGEEQDVKALKYDPDYQPCGVQSVSDSWQEREEAEALEGVSDLMRQVRKMRKMVGHALNNA